MQAGFEPLLFRIDYLLVHERFVEFISDTQFVLAAAMLPHPGVFAPPSLVIIS
jgi:hypothetical protein